MRADVEGGHPLATKTVALTMTAVTFALLIVWLGLGVAYFSPYPVGFWTTTFAFGLYLVVAGARRLSGSR